MKAKLTLAKAVSKDSHQGTKYGTKNYFKYHVCGVVASLKQQGFGNEYLIVGYLHDVVEDTHVTPETINNLFGEHIGEAVDAITKRKEETREVYLKRCAGNKIARIVKTHDALFNASNCFKNKNKSRFNYYMDTLHGLKVL